MRRPSTISRLLRSFLLLICVLSGLAEAQTTFSPRYTNTATNGDIALIGNVNYYCSLSGSQATSAQISTCSTARSGGIATNNGVYMIPIDTDSNAATSNSSSATLSMPAGSSVLFAGLYWTGISTSAANRTQVYFSGPATAGATLTSTTVYTIGSAYQSFVNVTSQVQAGGNGVYTVGNIASTAGAGNWAGWTLVVAYKNSTLPTRNLAIFDGLQQASDPAAPVNITVSGFLTPSVGTVKSTIGVVAYDGDRGQEEGAAVSPNGSLRFGPNASSLSTVFNAVNPVNDVFNSTISALGSDVTAGRNPNFTNTLGLDIDTFAPNTPLPNGSTSAVVRVIGTGNDVIYPGIITLATDIFVPNIKDSLTKSVTDVNGGVLLPGDLLEYELVIKNSGNDGAQNVIITDAIPANTTYVPGSIVVTLINAGTKTDAAGDDQAEYDSAGNRIVARLGTGATATAGGTLLPNAETRLRFRVKVNADVTGGTVINNSGQVTYRQQTLGGTVTDISDSDPNTPGDQPASSIVSGPDLTISKSHTGIFVQGQSGTFTLRVSNAGPGNTIGTVSVTDTLPSGVTATSIGGSGWSCTVSPLQCTRSDTLAVGGSYPDITLSVSTPTAGDYTNTANVSGGGEASTVTGNNSAADPFTVGATDLRLTKTGPASVLAGDTVTYTITVWNRGPSQASGTVITDAVPANLSNVTWTCTASGSAVCSTRGGSGDVNLSADLVYNTTTTGNTTPTSGSYVTIAVTGTAGTSSSISNVVSATHPLDLTPNSATATTTVNPKANLRISKTGPATAVAGTPVTYTLTLANDGPSSANGATYSDNVPSNLTGVTATCQNPSGGASGCTATVGSGNAVSGSVATFPAGASVQVQITGTVPPSATAALNNTATIAPPSGVTDPAPGNNTSATINTTLTQTADLSITKTNGVNVVTNGQVLTYTIVISNAGPSSTSVSFADTTFSGLTLSNWACTGTTGTAACPTGLPGSGGYSNSALSVPAGSSITLTVKGTVTATGGNVSNTTSITPPGTVTDPSGAANNTATDTDPFLVPQTADLSLTKTATPLVRPGTTISYTLTVTNAGPGSAASVVLSDSLPANVTYVSSTPSATVSGQALTWNLGTLANGGTQTITVQVTAPDTATLDSTPAARTQTNSASVTSDTADPSPNNNIASASTQLVVPPKLSKTVRNITTGTAAGTAGGGKPGEVLEYCVAYSNIGGAPITGFQVVDSVPGNATALLTGYDAERGSGSGYGVKLSSSATSYDTSAADADSGTLTGTGGTFGSGTMTLNLGTLNSGDSGSVCFRVTIR